MIKDMLLDSSDILKLKLALVRDNWPNLETNPTVPDPNTIYGLRMFYRGKELKNDVKLNNCNFQTTFKDEEGLVQPLTVCLLCHTSKSDDNNSQNFLTLKETGAIDPDQEEKPSSYLEYNLINNGGVQTAN